MIASSNDSAASSSGRGAVLRVTAVLGVLAVAILGVLPVLEIIPRALSGGYLTNSVHVILIVGLAIAAISYLTRARS